MTLCISSTSPTQVSWLVATQDNSHRPADINLARPSLDGSITRSPSYVSENVVGASRILVAISNNAYSTALYNMVR